MIIIYGYSYVNQRGLEKTNAVEIIVDMTVNRPTSGFDYQYYLIEPNPNVKSNCVYGTLSLVSNRLDRINGFNTNNEVSTYTFLENLRESKLVKSGNSNYTVYRYYFLGDCEYDSEIGKINSIRFTLIEDLGFDTVN